MFGGKNVSPNVAVGTRTDSTGAVVEEKRVEIDPYKELLADDGFASVACTLAATQPGSYGGKVSFMVSIRCDQDEAKINKAGELAFSKAAELCNDALKVLGWK